MTMEMTANYDGSDTRIKERSLNDELDVVKNTALVVRKRRDPQNNLLPGSIAPCISPK
jgi:hypothetical protein